MECRELAVSTTGHFALNLVTWSIGVWSLVYCTCLYCSVRLYCDKCTVRLCCTLRACGWCLRCAAAWGRAPCSGTLEAAIVGVVGAVGDIRCATVPLLLLLLAELMLSAAVPRCSIFPF